MADIVDLDSFRRRKFLELSVDAEPDVLDNYVLEDITELFNMISPIDNLQSIYQLNICQDRLYYFVSIAEDIMSKLDELGYFEEEIANDNDISEE